MLRMVDRPTRDHHRRPDTKGRSVSDSPVSPVDRRARRRQETIEEILDLALARMASDGVAGLTVSAIARDLKIKPPSIYKYFDSLQAIYDALFRRGQIENLAVLTTAVQSTESGLPALAAALEATGRWAITHPTLAELLFWRPVPGYEPAPDAFAPTQEIVALLREQLHIAADRNELSPDAASDEAMALLSALHFGIISQQLANEPGVSWEAGRFTRLLPQAIDMFVRTYRPAVRPVSASGLQARSDDDRPGR